jgi:hypothetical protein
VLMYHVVRAVKYRRVVMSKRVDEVLILMRVQVETNDPRPRGNASDAICVGSE